MTVFQSGVHLLTQVHGNCGPFDCQSPSSKPCQAVREASTVPAAHLLCARAAGPPSTDVMLARALADYDELDGLNVPIPGGYQVHVMKSCDQMLDCASA